jgi:DNA-binding PadR family transcriptional regulator
VLPSRKEVVVLDLLSRDGELYGLQLIEASDGALKRGTIYVTLSRMENKGYVESSLDDTAPSFGPPRRFYRITPLGRRVLRAWRTVYRSLRAEPAT